MFSQGKAFVFPPSALTQNLLSTTYKKNNRGTVETSQNQVTEVQKESMLTYRGISVSWPFILRVIY